MITAKDIGALAMMEKLTRIWLPEGTPREKIHAGFDGSEYKKLCAKWLLEAEARVDLLSKEMEYDYSFLLDDKERKRLTYDGSSYFLFGGEVEANIHFHYDERINFWRLYSTEPFPTEDEEPGYKFYGYMGALSFDDEYGLFIASQVGRPETFHSNQKRSQFTTRWLPFFRRNCWLFGCAIECSHQERVEWVKGWTREEIEEWNLKV